MLTPTGFVDLDSRSSTRTGSDVGSETREEPLGVRPWYDSMLVASEISWCPIWLIRSEIWGEEGRGLLAWEESRCSVSMYLILLACYYITVSCDTVLGEARYLRAELVCQLDLSLLAYETMALSIPG